MPTPSPDDIARHHAFDRALVERIAPQGESHPIEIVPSDPGWPAAFDAVAARIRGALGDRALLIQHVGSTSVAGLPAKPIVDVDLEVADPADEAAYVADLEVAGFTFVLREPAWHEHRFFTATMPRVNLHVFGPGCPETIRHRMLRDWLRTHPDDLLRYRDAKLEAAAWVNAELAAGAHLDTMDYNQRKEPAIVEILERVFRSHGLR